MMAVDKIFKKSIKSLLMKIHEYSDINNNHEGKRLLFRGQSDYKWEINSSANRFFKSLSVNESCFCDYYRDVIADFLTSSENLRLLDLNDRPNVRLMISEGEIIAQHHGMITRFVDWSKSPYIALFFACAGDSFSPVRNSKNSTIYVLDEEKLWDGLQRIYNLDNFEEVKDLLNNADISAPYVTKRERDKHNRRLNEQRGVLYSIPLGSSSFDQYVNGNKFPNGTLSKISFPSRFSLSILNNLRNMTICAGSLFNDLDFISTDVRYKLLRDLDF